MVVVTLLAGAYLAGAVLAPVINHNEAEAVPTECERNLCIEAESFENCYPVGTGYICGTCNTYEIIDEKPQRTNCKAIYKDGIQRCETTKCKEVAVPSGP